MKNQLKLSTDGIQSEGESRRSRPVGAYDAPEAESAVLSPSADIWSLGMMLVAAFNQRPLTWSRSSPLSPQVPKLLPPPYSQIAAECLHLLPAERCSLERVGVLLQPLSPAPKLEQSPAPPRRRSVSPLRAVMVLVVVAMVAAIAVIGWRARRTQAPAVRIPHPPPVAARPAAARPAARKVSSEPAGTSLASTTSAPAEPGRVLKRVLPDVPLSARMTIEPPEGKIRVRVHVSVDEAGEVASVSFVSRGPSRYFARLALEASEKWKFRPATIGGKPAPSQWLLDYRFGQQETEVDPAELQ